MPENHQCEGVLAALQRQHQRLGELLRELDDGRWWPDDLAGSEDAAEALAHAHAIEKHVGEVARIIATMKE